MIVADALSRKYLGPNDRRKDDEIINKFNLCNIRVQPQHYDFDLFL